MALSEAKFPSPAEAAGQRLRMSYEEYLTWAEGAVHAEWKDGEVTVSMPIKDRHQRVLELLYLVMGLFVHHHHSGLLRLLPFEVRLGPGGPSREPDIFFVANEHLDRLSDDRFVGGPDLVVEIISDDSVTRDYRVKRQEYQAAGVSEYWIVDPRPRHHRAEFYRLGQNGQYTLAGPDAAGIIQSEVLPGFWWQVSWFWESPAPSPLALLTTIMESLPEDKPTAAPSTDGQ